VTPRKKEIVTIVVFVVFASLWMGREISNYIARDRLVDEMHDFVNKGERFTAQDGEALKARIEALENHMKVD